MTYVLWKLPGVPISSEAGVRNFLADGYQLPPVQLNPDEAHVLLTADKLVRTLTDVAGRQLYEHTLCKINWC